MLSTVFKHSVSMADFLLTKVRVTGKITQECFKHDKNIFSPTLVIRTFLTKCIRVSDELVQPRRFIKPSKLSRSLLIRRQQTLSLDINTNVRNNVILYKNEQTRYFKAMQIFAIGQLFGWAILAWYTYTPGFSDVFFTGLTFKEYLKKYNYMVLLFILSVIVGPAIFSIIYVTCTRTVKYLILHKGGKTVTIITYHPLKKKSNMSLSVDKVKCPYSRSTSGMSVPLKIEDKSFHYILEKRGTFINTHLFDNTVGFAKL